MMGPDLVSCDHRTWQFTYCPEDTEPATVLSLRPWEFWRTIQIMTATRVTALDDGTPILETFDFRSEFAFDEFASWLAENLGIHAIVDEPRVEIEPFDFQWNGLGFRAAWDDEHGCFIAAIGGSSEALAQIQRAITF